MHLQTPTACPLAAFAPPNPPRLLRLSWLAAFSPTLLPALDCFGCEYPTPLQLHPSSAQPYIFADTSWVASPLLVCHWSMALRRPFEVPLTNRGSAGPAV